jgi:Fic family protein
MAGIRDAATAFTYQAFVPDPIADLTPGLPADLVQELEITRDAVAELQRQVAFTGLEALGRQLLRAESVGSSSLEGLILSQRKLNRAIVDPDVGDATAKAVVGNIRAMDEAIRIGVSGEALTLDDMLHIHKCLLEGTDDEAIAGHVRQEQNWIGGSPYSPMRAEFIPPPENELDRLLADLIIFMNRTDLPAIIQAAIAHAQFETLHPFIDGNGRVGRALIHTILTRRGLTPNFVPPVSLVLAANANRYIEGLTEYRSDDALAWCRMFTRTLYTATEHAKNFNQALAAMQLRWREAAGNPRSHSAAEKLIQALPAHPIVNIKIACTITGGSDEGARKALNELEQAGVLSPATVGKKKNRMWEARELLTLLDNFEWQLATPTRSGEPRRASPQYREFNR